MVILKHASACTVWCMHSKDVNFETLVYIYINQKSTGRGQFRFSNFCQIPVSILKLNKLKLQIKKLDKTRCFTATSTVTPPSQQKTNKKKPLPQMHEQIEVFLVGTAVSKPSWLKLLVQMCCHKDDVMDVWVICHAKILLTFPSAGIPFFMKSQTSSL